MEIVDVLAPMKCPVTHAPYKGDARTYITYELIAQVGGMYGDDEETETVTHYGLDLYTDQPFSKMLKQIKTLLAQAGYTIEIGMETYEDDMTLWHVELTATIGEALYG